jgi:hypothetical protein
LRSTDLCDAEFEKAGLRDINRLAAFATEATPFLFPVVDPPMYGYEYASPSHLSLPVTLSYRSQIDSLIAARFPEKMMVSSADPSPSSMNGKSPTTRLERISQPGLWP